VRIHKLPIGSDKAGWLRAFRRFLQANGPFAAVHSHVYFFSAPVLSAAKAAKVPVRIGHCHAARSQGNDHRTLRHKFRRTVATIWLKRVATRRIGISDAAIAEIAGTNWKRDPATCVLLYGFDFSRFRGAGQRAARLRQEHGIDDKVPVIGHVGRFETVKNHGFLLEVFAALLRGSPEARLVLVGDGPTRADMAAKAKALGIADRVHFVGTNDDVPAYMRMFDVFVLTSFSEGLGIVCVEAQAAGTPAIVSDAVANEVSVVAGAVRFLPLAAGADVWAEAITDALKRSRSEEGEWLDQVERSPFAIGRCIDELDRIYVSELEHAG
jgi:glycosyltransferase involved in cell wall biosynthesis